MEWKNTIPYKDVFLNDITNKEQKEKIANKVIERVKDDDVIGVGSGSTSYLALLALGNKIKKEKLNIIVIPTSSEVELTCAYLSIPTTSLSQKKPDWSFDGADEVDPQNNMIKGRGGAMFVEKLVMSSSLENYILIDNSKMVNTLGEKHPIPIEVFPKAINLVEMNLSRLGVKEISLRLAKGKDGPVITEAGNYILDVYFKKIEQHFEKEIKSIPGVIESGLFIGYNVNIIKL